MATGNAAELEAGSETLRLHCFGAFDAEERERADKFAEGDGGRGEKECFARGIFFCEDVVAMVEIGELLRELECVPREMGRLGGGDALLQDLRAASGAEP